MYSSANKHVQKLTNFIPCEQLKQYRTPPPWTKFMVYYTPHSHATPTRLVYVHFPFIAVFFCTTATWLCNFWHNLWPFYLLNFTCLLSNNLINSGGLFLVVSSRGILVVSLNLSSCKGTQVFPMQFEWIQREVNWSWGTQVKVLFQVLSSECFCQLGSYNNVYLAGVLQSISKSRFLWHCLPHRAGGGRQRETPPAMLQLVAKLLFSLSPPKQFDNSDNECVAWKGTRRSSDKGHHSVVFFYPPNKSVKGRIFTST